MVRCRCPNDAMLIPQVAEVSGAAEPVRFFWCWSCAELFAFVGEPGRFAAGFVEDGGGWRVFRAVGSPPDMQTAVAAVSQVWVDLTAGMPMTDPFAEPLSRKPWWAFWRESRFTSHRGSCRPGASPVPRIQRLLSRTTGRQGEKGAAP